MLDGYHYQTKKATEIWKEDCHSLLPGDRDCINEERVNAMAQVALDKINRVGGRGNDLPHACGLRPNDQPEGDGAHKYRL